MNILMLKTFLKQTNLGVKFDICVLAHLSSNSCSSSTESSLIETALSFFPVDSFVS